MKDNTLYQITHIHAHQYSMKKWDLGEWGRTHRYGLKKTENSSEWKKISKSKAEKILDDKFGLFVREVKKLGVSTTPYIHMETNGNSRGRNKPKEPIVAVQWITGGLTGGNCWQDHDETCWESMSGDPEPELTDLDTILEHFKPDISFIQYKRLYQELIERGEHRSNEYYGNYTDYAHKFIRLRRLYNYLSDKGWLQHLVEE